MLGVGLRLLFVRFRLLLELCLYCSSQLVLVLCRFLCLVLWLCFLLLFLKCLLFHLVWSSCLLFFLFLFFGMRVALRAKDRFGALLAAGITAMIGVQTVINVAVVVGVMPTTGLPLPFFSSGGTSISILMGAVGVLLSVSAQGDAR